MRVVPSLPSFLDLSLPVLGEDWRGDGLLLILTVGAKGEAEPRLFLTGVYTPVCIPAVGGGAGGKTGKGGIIV